MTPFTLKIVTPEGVAYDGVAEELIVRTVIGDMGIMAGHINAVVPLGKGQVTVLADGQRRYGTCASGMVSVVNGVVTLVSATFAWTEEQK